MFATSFKAAGAFLFVWFDMPFLKKHILIIVWHYSSIFGQYLTIFVPTNICQIFWHIWSMFSSEAGQTPGNYMNHQLLLPRESALGVGADPQGESGAFGGGWPREWECLEMWHFTLVGMVSGWLTQHALRVILRHVCIYKYIYIRIHTICITTLFRGKMCDLPKSCIPQSM